jgi:hypothetical protein
VWEQVVTDAEGRRRFHGAFTGGFSAGYFNTVGSKEGWAPSTFVSSRAQRANRQQRPEDFMDDEDYSVHTRHPPPTTLNAPPPPTWPRCSQTPRVVSRVVAWPLHSCVCVCVCRVCVIS